MLMHSVRRYTPEWILDEASLVDPGQDSDGLQRQMYGTPHASQTRCAMTDREAKSRAVKILAKSIYRDLEAQGFDEKQIVALATELISEVTTKISRSSTEKQQHA
jgi:hypothetical protein